MKKSKNDELMLKILEDSKFRGKHVIVIGGEIFVAKTGEQAKKILDKVHRKYPKESPAITYIPKADSLILWLL